MAAHARVTATALTLGIGTSLNPLNSSMVAVALIAFREDFSLSIPAVTWVITTFYLASASLQPVMGRLADRFGAKRVFILGMSIAAVTCALAPFSPNFILVCLARVFLGIGTSAAFPSALSLVTSISREAGIGSARPLAYLQMSNSSAAAVGPALGGILVAVADWQAVFFINVPLALFALVGTAFLAPSDRAPERGPVIRLIRDSDLPGILAFSLTLVSLLMAVLDAVPGWRWHLAFLAIVSAALFTWRELRFDAPFLDLRRLARNPTLLLTYAGFLVSTAIFYCVLYGLPQLLEVASGYDPAAIGLLMFPLAAVSVAVTPLTARALERWGLGPVLLTGTVGLAGCSALLLVLGASTASIVVLVLVAVFGMPFSVVSLASSQSVYVSVQAAERGVSAGILQTARYLGAITATAVIGAVHTSGATVANWTTLVFVMVIGAAIAVLIAWRLNHSALRGD